MPLRMAWWVLTRSAAKCYLDISGHFLCIVGEGVTCVGEYAFDDCVNLINLYLGGVQRIGEKAFRSTKLDELVDSGNLQVIENHAFNACDVLYKSGGWSMFLHTKEYRNHSAQ